MKDWAQEEDDKYSWLYENGYPIGNPMRIVNKYGLLKEQSCIDLGCGRACLSTYFVSYVGIDVSKYIIDHNKKTRSGDYFHASLDRLSDISLGRSYFDVAICSDVMEHIPEVEVCNVLSSISSLDVKNFYFAISTRKSGYLDKNKQNLHLSVFSSEKWKSLLSKFFSIENEDKIPDLYTVKCARLD